MLTIQIKTGNAAFDESPELEIARILKELANQIALGNEPTKLRDINGNTIGIVTYN